MTIQDKQLLAQKLETGLLFVWGFTFLLFPLFVTTLFTDALVLPKELLLGGVVLLSLLVWGVQMMLNQQVRVRRTPLDIPIILFTLAILLSSIFSNNRLDSLFVAVPVVFAALGYFVLVNAFRTKKVGMFLLSSLLTGGILATAITLLAHYKIYLLPFAFTKTPTFSPLGTYLEYALVMVILLPLTFSFVAPMVKGKLTARVGVFALAGLILLAGIGTIGVSLLAQKPILLPFDTGFQTAFAAVSQDSGRVLQTFLFGEGYGNFAAVFSRFHNSAFNANQQLWFLSFNNSSSYLLELLATTGFVGVLTFLFLIYKTLTPVAKKKNNPFFFSLLVIFVLSVVLPFSTIEVTVLFFLLAGMSIAQREASPQDYFDVELKFVALKKGMFSFTTLDETEMGRPDRHVTPIVAFVLFLIIVIVLGYYSTIYAVSDAIFQQSLVAANSNNGTVTYRLQAQAISIFPYRSDYYRLFSQTNISLANSLLSLQSGKSSPSATVQQTALTLIQQGITTAKQATVLSPDSALAWQNLSSVYRALIGVGQNAQNFAVNAAQQATVLDSSNPQEYLNLGGLYYQLGQYDSAIQVFQQAIATKSDYANAYYNLGHAYEQKGDLQSALQAYQNVAQLVANDPTNLQKINAEIAALQAKMGKTANANTTAPASNQTTGTQQPLSLPSANQLPQQQQQVPLVSPTPAK